MLPAEITVLLKFAVEKRKRGLEFKRWEFRSRLLVSISGRFSSLSIAKCLWLASSVQRGMNQLRMSCSVWPALGRAEMCAGTNPSCLSGCRAVLSKGYVGEKSAKSEVLLHHSATYFLQNITFAGRHRQKCDIPEIVGGCLL